MGSSGKKSRRTAAKTAHEDAEIAAGAATRRRVLLALVALAVVALASILWVVTSGEDSPSGTASSSANESADRSPSATSVPEGSSSQPGTPPPTTGTPPPTTGTDDLPVSLEPVPLDQTADFGDEVSAQLLDLEGIQAQGQGVGEISGPAIRVTVQLTNGTGAPLSLDAVTVSLYFAPALTPAPPISDPEAVPFRGSLAAGESAEAIYTFSIGNDDRDDISVTVSHSPSSTMVVFNGAFS